MLVTAEVSHTEISPYVVVAVAESMIQEFTASPMLLSVMAVVSLRLRTVVSLEIDICDRSKGRKRVSGYQVCFTDLFKNAK